MEEFGDGVVIFREGDPVGPVYLVEKGTVRISRKAAKENEETILGDVPPGGIFGEMALVDGKPRMATATAVGQTICVATSAVLLQRKVRMMDAETYRFYTQMVEYIRDTVPFEARSPQAQEQGATSADRAARQMLDKLPGVIAQLQKPPPVIVTVFQMFGEYIQRRLPPSLR